MIFFGFFIFDAKNMTNNIVFLQNNIQKQGNNLLKFVAGALAGRSLAMSAL
jgi:hypothetical protein